MTGLEYGRMYWCGCHNDNHSNRRPTDHKDKGDQGYYRYSECRKGDHIQAYGVQNNCSACCR